MRRKIWASSSRGPKPANRLPPCERQVVDWTVRSLWTPAFAGATVTHGFHDVHFESELLRSDRCPAGFAPLLPAIALFYAAATVASAILFWRGCGGRWKGRFQASKA